MVVKRLIKHATIAIICAIFCIMCITSYDNYLHLTKLHLFLRMLNHIYPVSRYFVSGYKGSDIICLLVSGVGENVSPGIKGQI